MAIYHLSAQVISRGYGHSAVHAAAYRARDDLTDERTGLDHDYSRKAGELLFEGIYAPKDAPAWARDRQQLWNHVEAFEKHRRAELAREFNIALPCELTLEQNRYALQDWVRDNFTRKGLIADVAIHAPSEKGDDRNMHAHVMVVMRKLDGSEFVRTKERFDTYSEKQAAKKAELESLRSSWERIGNRHLERHGFEPTLDHRTLKAQGIEREPGYHIGKDATAIERSGKPSELGDVNRQISADNERKVIDLAAERAMREAHSSTRGLVDDIRPPGQANKNPRDAKSPAEAVQGHEAAAAPSAPGQPATRTTEPERAAQDENLRSVPRNDGGEKNYSKREGEQLDNAAAQPVGFFGRIAGWFQNWWNMGGGSAAQPQPNQQPQQAADLAGYFDQTARDRVLDGIRHDDAERQAEKIKAAEPEKDLRVEPGLAERFGHHAMRDLGPSDEEISAIKAAKIAAIRRQHEETERAIEERARNPDRGYEME